MNPEEIQEAAKEAGYWQEHTNTWMCSTEAMYELAAIIEKVIEKRTIERCESALDKVMVTDHSLNTFKRCKAAIRKLGEQ